MGGGSKIEKRAPLLTLMFEFLCRPVPETEEEKQLLSKYCLPEADKFRLSEHLMHPPTKETYRIWMHEMLYIEEWAQMDHISRYTAPSSGNISSLNICNGLVKENSV